jgi:hypothetical protein
LFETGGEIVRKAASLLCEETGQPALVRPVPEDLAELGALSLISGQGELLGVHRLMQEVVRNRIPEERRRDWIGLALARELSRRGWSVSLLARRSDLLEDVAAVLRAAGRDAFAARCDVTSAQSVQEAVQYVGALHQGGGTNIHGALEKAFADPEADAIYFLTDGMPTDGKKKDNAQILQDVAAWTAQRKAVVNTIAFLMGSFSSDNKPKSRELMLQLAKATGGVYRAIE